MKFRQMLALALIGGCLLAPLNGVAGLFTTPAREVGDAIFSKFGKGAAGSSADEITSAATNAIARHGKDAAPLLKNSGHAGFQALDIAGDKAPEVIKLYAKRGDEALWVISEPKRLAIFIKHGDSAADALIKHPGLADNLVERFGGDAATALTAISKPSAQRLAMVAEEGLLNASARNPELLPVIRLYGDSAMEFIWKNKGALAVASVLGTFLADPNAYISGVKELAVPVLSSINWTLIVAGILTVLFLPFIARVVVKTRKASANKALPS
jgi:hypothetical protein